MTEHTCDSCNHWVQYVKLYPMSSTNLAQGGVCRCPKIAEDCGQPINDMLLYEYNEGGHFYTGPKFGCVHHEHRKSDD